MPTGRPVGRPPKPVAVKIAEGNPGKRALPKATAQATRGASHTPPPTLGEDGKKLWLEIWAKATWLTDADLIVVLELCQTYEEKEYVRRALATGAVERSYVLPNGAAVSHPYVAQLKDLRALINGHLSALGLDPSSRARLGLADAIGESNPIAEMMARRAARNPGGA